jgi:hypothetical protein
MTDAHTEQLIATKVRRLEELEKQQALHGSLTPPHISIELEDLRQEIADLRYQRTQLIFQANHLALEPPPAAQGLILLVSPRRPNEALHELSNYHAIEYHRATLRACWLIATAGPSGSLATAEALASHFGAYQLQCTICPIANGADAAETLARVAAIYTQIADDGALQAAEVLADITGGSKAMTAGVALACGTAHHMQYMLYQANLPSLPVLLHTAAAEAPV